METKTMWTSEGGVSQVTVREENGVTLVSGDGEPWWAAEPGVIHETEVEARLAWLRSQEAGHENDLERENAEIHRLRDAHKHIQEQLQASYRARDKARDALSEVQAQLAQLDAVEGRR
jgi:hypothetical protein